jgi:hypothetical protein
MQVDTERTDPRPVLRRRANPIREPAAADMPALAAPERCDVVDHPERSLLGNVEHLPRLAATNAFSVTETSAALIAAPRRMLNT